jgi:hypothetical protein
MATPSAALEHASPSSPDREDEQDLARGVPESELQQGSDDLSVSGLDLALRLQDALGTWREGHDTAPEEVGHADDGDQSEDELDPFVPLTESGGQGI